MPLGPSRHSPGRLSSPRSTPARQLALAVATVAGVGYVPVAPGTAGSVIGLALWMVLPATTIVQTAAILCLAVAGSLAGHVAEQHFAETDPRQVVVDETAGMLITLYLIPVGWMGALVGFVLFRAADVVKPFPANRLERLPGGVGVMADDAMAGIYANIALRAAIAMGNWIIG